VAALERILDLEDDGVDWSAVLEDDEGPVRSPSPPLAARRPEPSPPAEPAVPEATAPDPEPESADPGTAEPDGPGGDDPPSDDDDDGYEDDGYEDEPSAGASEFEDTSEVPTVKPRSPSEMGLFARHPRVQNGD
jgi:hypothetical protein